MSTLLAPWIACDRSGGRRDVAAAAWIALAAAALCAGCASNPVRFPAAPLLTAPADNGLLEAYDTDGDKRPDYFTTQDAAGRKVRIAYDMNRDGQPDSAVWLDEISPADARHLVLILDGIGYETIEAMRREGRFRLFHPPAPVISTFPPMTDVVLTDVFQSTRCYAIEAAYFDHQANRMAGGDTDYLSMRNEDWARRVDYRAGTLTDPLAYIFPDSIFDKEMNDLVALWNRRDRPRLVAYLVSAAGMGTKHLLEGQRKVLASIDRLCEEIIWRSRGLAKITMLSDHGHTLVRGKWVDFRKYLKDKGWNVAGSLHGPRDVVPIEYGLVTYCSYATLDRPGLATTLLEHPAVDLVTYVDGDAVVVESASGKALVERRGRRYRYRTERGDPLDLAAVIEKMKADRPDALDADGFADDRVWLAATADHKYPDPLDRLWRAYHGQTEHVSDVIASLKEGYNSGLASRAWRFPDGASTHGDLGRRNSTAFIMSTAAPVDSRLMPLRHRDLPPVLEMLTARPWPPPRGGDGK